MSDNLIRIGENDYTPLQIQVINELFGDGFLQANPHFPGRGGYTFSDDYPYHKEYPLLLQQRQRQMAAEAEVARQIEAEQNREQSILLEACAELSGTMSLKEEKIIARVLGNSKNDCREKFVRQHLNYEGSDWQEKYKQWLGRWHYERFVPVT